MEGGRDIIEMILISQTPMTMTGSVTIWILNMTPEHRTKIYTRVVLMILERVGKTTMVTENKQPMYYMKIRQILPETFTIGWHRHMPMVSQTSQTTRRPTLISMTMVKSSSLTYTTLQITQEDLLISNR